MPYARLSSYYFFYFAALGALLPFWGPYLLERGFQPAAIGVLMAILVGTKIVSPNLWGLLADRVGQRMPIVRLGAGLAAMGFVGVFWAGGKQTELAALKKVAMRKTFFIGSYWIQQIRSSTVAPIQIS